MNTVSKTRPFEYLRLTSLGVIGALVKARPCPFSSQTIQSPLLPPCLQTPPPLLSNRARQLSRPQVDDTDVINFLLSTEIIPLCLRTMEMGSELSKTVATFIVQKILLDEARRAAPARSASPGRACAAE